jgi:hypothetical protein
MVEESWDVFPWAKTVIAHPRHCPYAASHASRPEVLRVLIRVAGGSFGKFCMTITTIIAPGERGVDGSVLFQENAHGLDSKDVKIRQVRRISIEDSGDVEKKKYDANCDPALFRSAACPMRTPLAPGWATSSEQLSVCP